MPWSEVSIMEQREEFVGLAGQPDSNIRLLSRRFGVSPTTAYKWLSRYGQRGREGLCDQTRRPEHSPRRCCAAIEDAVLRLRDRHPAWGARKLRRRLSDIGSTDLPSPSTVHQILLRHGRVDPKDSVKHRAFQRFEHPNPNQLWQMDFKGHFATQKARCHPLTVLDDHSRFSLGLRACPDQRTGTVKDGLTSIFRRYGLPDRMTMDNGSPWGSDSEHRFTPLTAWLIRLDVRVSHSRPYHPQTQGKDERFHRTLNQELLRRHSFCDLSDTQSAFDHWRHVYNFQRPHDALELAVPASRYQPSPRSFPEILPPVLYQPGDLIRKVQLGGEIWFQGRPFKIGNAFYRQPVALRPSTLDGLFDVFFCHQKIAQIDLTSSEIPSY
jgi:transposase InsO family protein